MEREEPWGYHPYPLIRIKPGLSLQMSLSPSAQLYDWHITALARFYQKLDFQLREFGNSHQVTFVINPPLGLGCRFYYAYILFDHDDASAANKDFLKVFDLNV